MMDAAAERLPHSPPPGGEALDGGHEPMPYPCPSVFRPTEVVYDDLFSRIGTNFGLGPLHHKGRESGRDPETGTIRRREPTVFVV